MPLNLKRSLSILILILLGVVCHCKTLNVKSFGAKGNGKSNDLAAIQKAVDALSDGDVLLFPKGDYRVGLDQNKTSVITISGKNSITIKGRNASIILDPNGHTHYNIIEIINSNNIKVKKLILIGDRLYHDYGTVNSTHEFGYGICIVGNSPDSPVNVDVSKCEIYDMTGDAIVTKNGISTGHISIKSCELHHCRRQGISVLDSDAVSVNRCFIYSIGSSDGIKGTAPMAGIDIEPASGTRSVRSLSVNGTTITNCDYISIVGSPEVLSLTDCKLEDISLHDNDFSGTSPTGIIKNNVFHSSSSRRHYFAVRGFIIEDSQIVWTPSMHSTYCEIWADGLKNCVVEGIMDVETGEYLLGCRSDISDSRLESIRIVNSKSSKMGVHKKNHYKKCYFLMYESPEDAFDDCSFVDCASDSRYQPKVKFKNCKISKPFMKNQVFE